MTDFALVGARIFDGARVLDDHAVMVGAGRIRSLAPAGDIGADVEVRRIEGLLAPGFIDVQVNGGGGVLFNDAPTVEGIRSIGSAHRRFGTTGFLPTLITDTRETMQAAVEAVRAGLAAGVPGLLGIHLEGPFLNPKRKGVHDPKCMRPIEAEDIRIMTSLGAGRTLVTLAPEMVPMRAIAELNEAGVLVSAGHTEASYDLLAEAHRHGLSGYTHLFNAMPPLMSREAGPVGAALHLGAFFGLIVDFHHVFEPTLAVVFAKAHANRLMLITDGMPVTGTEMPSFELQGRTIFRKDGRLVTEDGTLAGSDLDMATAVRNSARIGGSERQALEQASLNPARFLRLDRELGRIRPDYRASFVLLDANAHVKTTWIDGEESP